MKKIIKSYIMVLTGLALAALGVVAFVLPSGIMIGSVTGIGRIVQHFYDLPVSYTVAFINGILFLIGALIMGKNFALSTVVSTFAYPLFINIFEKIEILQQITSDPMTSAIYGGVLIGIGMGIVIKAGASTGGTDIVAIILNKKFGLPLGLPMYLIDFTILLSQIFIANNAEQILMGIMLTFLYSMIADKVVVIGGSAVQLLIISTKYEEIRKKLAEDVIGTTVFYGETGFLGIRQDTILCITSNRELNHVQRDILSIDPEAFITISSVKEVKGRGYTFEVGKAKQIRNEKAKQTK